MLVGIWKIASPTRVWLLMSGAFVYTQFPEINLGVHGCGAEGVPFLRSSVVVVPSGRGGMFVKVGRVVRMYNTFRGIEWIRVGRTTVCWDVIRSYSIHCLGDVVKIGA